MNRIRHGEIPTWYDKFSQYEACFNDESANAKHTNQIIEKLLKKYQVKTVLDLTCGTGSQVFYLLKRGYDVVGSDISVGMLKLAKQKALSEKTKVKLLRGDMRTTKVGKFDAVITIFNAIGHLTKTDFGKTLKNIHRNLNDGGIYLFDIINLNYVRSGDNIMKLSLEKIETRGNTKIRKIQYSTVDDKGILTSYTTFYTQKDSGKLKVSTNVATLQLYTAKELKALLHQQGFKLLKQCSMDGSPLHETKTERILTVAQKQSVLC